LPYFETLVVSFFDVIRPVEAAMAAGAACPVFAAVNPA
jgi:hypothetical protein